MTQPTAKCIEPIVKSINKAYKKEAMLICSSCIDRDMIDYIPKRLEGLNKQRKEVILGLETQMPIGE